MVFQYFLDEEFKKMLENCSELKMGSDPVDTIGCVGTKILTASCGHFDYADPQPESICIEDIALALSNTCRFSGHLEFYSVAEHSLHCLEIARQMYDGNEELQFAALMHDAAESVIGDMPKPLKLLCPAYRAIEARAERMIEKKFQISTEYKEQVKEIDLMMLKAEKKAFFPNAEDWGSLDHIPDAGVLLCNDTPEEACGIFLAEAMIHLDRKGIS